MLQVPCWEFSKCLDLLKQHYNQYQLMVCLFANTIADCLKYRRKIGGNLAVRVLQESIAQRKCSEPRLRHFAKICRVGKLVQNAYSLVASNFLSSSVVVQHLLWRVT